MSKEACIIVLDVGKSMGKIQAHSGMTGLDKAKAAFRLIVQQKLLFGAKQDMYGVVLFNTNNTSNRCADQHGGYEHIQEYFELQTPSLDLLECIDSVNIQKGSGDVLDALLVSAEIIVDFVKKRKYRKRIFMITDCNSSMDDVSQLKIIADSFVEQDIAFNCIGIGFGDEDDDDDDDDSDDDDDIDVKNDDGDDDKSWNKIKIIGGDRNRAASIIENEKIIRHFGHLVSGNIFNGASAIKMMSELRTKSVLMRPTYNGVFNITSSISIQCKLYTRCREMTLPSLKKQSSIGNNTGKVIMDRLYVNKFRKEDDEEVEEDERVKSYIYGKEWIPFNENDEQRLKYQSGMKHFQCLGFISADKIDRQQYMGPTFIAVSVADNPGSSYSLSSFIRACSEKNCYCLARLVTRKNGNPKFVVLEPRIKTTKEVFIINELPFYEDLRKYPFASFNVKKKYIPNKKQINIAKNLINSLDLMTANVDDDGDKMEALRPQNTFNPILQRFYQNLQARALDPQNSLQALDPMILKYLEPDPILFNNQNTQKCFNEFSQSFPTKLIPKKQIKKDRQHWNDISNELDNILDFGDDDNDNNKIKNDNNDLKDDDNDDIDIDIGGLLNVDDVTKIGTKTPQSDFDKLLAAKSSPDLFQKLHNELWQVINGLIDNSYLDNDYNHALECIKFIKNKSIREEEPNLFNNKLKQFKSKYENKKKPAIFNYLLQKKDNFKEITLINNNDFVDDIPDGFNVDKKESDEFLLKKVVDNVKKNDIMDIESDDDDLADLI